ncbi:hypothetical protein D3C76_1457390 [compost metagenome]
MPSVLTSKPNDASLIIWFTFRFVSIYGSMLLRMEGSLRSEVVDCSFSANACMNFR